VTAMVKEVQHGDSDDVMAVMKFIQDDSDVIDEHQDLAAILVGFSRFPSTCSTFKNVFSLQHRRNVLVKKFRDN